MVPSTAPLLGQEAVAATPPEPRFLLSRVDGTRSLVQLTGVRGRGEALELRVRRLNQTRWVAVKEVLGLQGPAVPG